jgi:hypothetical protein
VRIVQTAFLDGERLQMLIDGDGPSLAYTGDRKLIIARRRPLPTDWVNGEFVGDHAEPDKDDPAPHVHGEVAA